MRRRLARKSRPRPRRGVALFDVIVGGVMLGIGLAVVLSLTSRSLALQTDGEKRLTASWLADEILTMILVEGPDRYPRLYDTSGRYGDPFGDYFYEVQIEDLGRGAPYRVNALVRWSDRANDVVQVETLIALRIEEEEQLREPQERVDRLERHYEDEAP
jgi:hypothetical protein